MINQKAVEEAINQITDSKVKRRLVNILNGKIVKQLRCNSDTCKGRVIGYVYADGMLEADELRNNIGELISGALAIRPRLDGFDGVECACGQDSRIAESEKGYLKDNGVPPTASGLEAIFNIVKENPTQVVKKNGTISVDGFIIEEVT